MEQIKTTETATCYMSGIL